MKKTLNILITALAIALFIGCEKDEEIPQEETTFDFVVGDTYQGGIIFYIDETGEHGLIAYTEDLPDAPWGCFYNNDPNFEPPTEPIAQNNGIGFGAQNTQAIIDFCDEPNSAASFSATLNANGYDDWYLPSIDELALIYENRDLIGGFPNLDDPDFFVLYASSSEFFPSGDGNGGQIYLNYNVFDFTNPPIFDDSRKLNTNKSNENRVRPIRSF